MSLPKFREKFGRPAIFAARDLIARQRSADDPPFPEQAVIGFQDRTVKFAKRKFGGRAHPSPFGEMALLKKTGGHPVAIAGGFGIGAPAAVFMLEWMAALGVRRFVAVGYAGGLHERQGAGDLVVCSAALRDEGASHHYLPPADYSRPDAALTSALQQALSRGGAAHELGPTWTTDAPFRETFAEVEHYRAQGILTVEMEAAALFAAAEALGADCAAAFVVSDAPRGGAWGLDFDRGAMHAGLETLTAAAVEVLANGLG